MKMIKSDWQSLKEDDVVFLMEVSIVKDKLNFGSDVFFTRSSSLLQQIITMERSVQL